MPTWCCSVCHHKMVRHEIRVEPSTYMACLVRRCTCTLKIRPRGELEHAAHDADEGVTPCRRAARLQAAG